MSLILFELEYPKIFNLMSKKDVQRLSLWYRDIFTWYPIKIFSNYLEDIQSHIQQRYPKIWLYVHFDIQIISSIDVHVISKDLFLNLQPRYLDDIHRYPIISVHFHLPCLDNLPQHLGWWDGFNSVCPSRKPFWLQACPLLASWDHFCACMPPASIGVFHNHRCPAGLQQSLRCCHGPEICRFSTRPV